MYQAPVRLMSAALEELRLRRIEEPFRPGEMGSPCYVSLGASSRSEIQQGKHFTGQALRASLRNLKSTALKERL